MNYVAGGKAGAACSITLTVDSGEIDKFQKFNLNNLIAYTNYEFYELYELIFSLETTASAHVQSEDTLWTPLSYFARLNVVSCTSKY